MPLESFSIQAVRERLYQVLMEDVAKDLLLLSIFRSEPWVVKRRPKSFLRMTKPRNVLKTALAN